MFDEIAKAKDIFWEEFQGTGMGHEIFDVLFDSAIEKLKRNLTSQSSGRDGAGVNLDTEVCPTCGSTRLFGGILASRR